MGSFYSRSSRELQERFDSVALADRLEQVVISDQLGEADQEFVASRDFFFLSTVGADGFPTVSYKGGGPGFVALLGPRTLAFPSYDGNGMFLSMGNLVETAKIGMLFIDFVEPRRLRVQATADLNNDADLLARYPGAQLVVVAEVTAAFVNCPRYVHRHDRVAASKYVPDEQGDAPFAPWKRLDGLQDAVPAADRARIAEEGGPISRDQYAAILEEEAGSGGGSPDR